MMICLEYRIFLFLLWNMALIYGYGVNARVSSPNMTWIAAEDCSREKSRQVRQYLNSTIYKMLPYPAYELPTSCPLHPLQDIYRDQELHKNVKAKSECQCQYCGKSFRTEFYLDKHMHHKHPDKLKEGFNNCYADLCGIFGCKNNPMYTDMKATKKLWEVRSSKKRSPARTGPDGKEFKLDDTCTDTDVERRQYQCQVLMRKCFSSNPPLQADIEKMVCGKLHCENGLLVGSIPDINEVDAQEGDDTFVSRVFQIIILLIIVGFLCFYICMVGVKMPKWFDFQKTKSVQAKGRWRKESASTNYVNSAVNYLGSMFGQKSHKL